MNQYQIFISYRRNGGEALAQLIKDRLQADGYHVFIDVESLRSGDFNEQLYAFIEECTAFVLILPPNALDRCSDPKDWVRKECEHALSCKKTIIPVLMRGFDFNDVELPESLADLPNKQGIEANMTYFDASIERLESLLNTRPAAIAARFSKARERTAMTDEDLVKLFAETKQQAEVDDAQAQYRLALMYYHGLAVNKDDIEAVFWFDRAAGNNVSRATAALAYCYANGVGAPQDAKKAFQLLLHAAEQGNPSAQLQVGRSYEYGEGVNKDLGKAAQWYKTAAGSSASGDETVPKDTTQQDPDTDHTDFTSEFEEPWENGNAKAEAQFRYAECLKNGRGIEADPAKALYWYHKAAQQEHVAAQHTLGLCYYTGSYVARDDAQAVFWLRKAADHGFPPALAQMGACYVSGRGVDKDPKAAISCYTKAADKGYVPAQYDLAHLHTKNQDMGSAFKWYQIAAEQGHAAAQNSLGICYQNGSGVTKNIEEAIKWFKKSADQGNKSASYNLALLHLDFAADTDSWPLNRIKSKKEALSLLATISEGDDALAAKASKKIREIKHNGFVSAAKYPGVLLGFLLFAGVIWLCINPTSDRYKESAYYEGMAYYDKGDYGRAEGRFMAAEDFSDAKLWALYARLGESYADAIELYEQGKYEQAKAIFEALGDYEDALAWAEKAAAAVHSAP